MDIWARAHIYGPGPIYDGPGPLYMGPGPYIWARPIYLGPGRRPGPAVKTSTVLRVGVFSYFLLGKSALPRKNNTFFVVCSYISQYVGLRRSKLVGIPCIITRSQLFKPGGCSMPKRYVAETRSIWIGMAQGAFPKGSQGQK